MNKTSVRYGREACELEGGFDDPGLHGFIVINMSK
jgi:hypothetical protein